MADDNVVTFEGKHDALPRSMRPIFAALLRLTHNQPAIVSSVDEDGTEWQIELSRVERGSGSAEAPR